MIIGKGMIANRFMSRYKDDSNVIIFASGVSDSTEKNEELYNREKILLNEVIEKNSSKKFVYFSSIMVLSGMESEYLKHKIKIENLIKERCKEYLIIRLPQILGDGGNKKNIANHFNSSVKNDIALKIQKNTIRSIIDVDDLFGITSECIDKINNEIVNLSYIEKINIYDLAKLFYKIHNKNENIIEMEQGYSIITKNSSIIDDIISTNNIIKDNYTQKVLYKYFYDKINSF